MALSSAVATRAQEVLVVKLNNGRELSFPNGIERTNVYFWGNATEGEPRTEFNAADSSTIWEPQFEGLRVADYVTLEGKYAVAIAWLRPSELPSTARMGICIGREANVSVENCDTLFYTTSQWESKELASWLLSANANQSSSDGQYLLLGDSLTFFSTSQDMRQWSGTRVQQQLYNQPWSWRNYPLSNGETYYYRVFASVPYEAVAGSDAEAFFYGEEQYFRIPNLKADAGYTNGDIYFSSEAWTEFYKHFGSYEMSEEQKEVLEQQTLPKLQKKWEATLGALPYDLSTATDFTFDDGIVHILPAIPKAFYEWICKREIVVNSLQSGDFVSRNTIRNDELIPLTQIEQVVDADESWGVPGNRYMVCSPITYQGMSNRNSQVYVNLTEAIPGVHYKLSITFVPDTVDAPIRLYRGITSINQNDPVRDDYTPWGYIKSTTMARRDNFIMNEEAERETNEFTIAGISEESAMKVQKIEASNVDILACSTLYIESNASIVQLRKGTQTNILRIAEVRLTPIPQESDGTVTPSAHY